MGFAEFIRDVLRHGDVGKVFAVSSAVFALVYVFGVGMVFQLPFALPPSFTTPSVDVVLDGPLGQVPLVTIYVNSRWAFSFNPEALTALTALSILFGLSMAATLYAGRCSACNVAKRIHLSWAAVLPSFFSFFTCCGGGVVSSILIALGMGLSLLQDYGRLFTIASASALAANLYITYRRVARVSRTFHKI
ncbi:MAG: hypothetical protein QXE96_01580 [Candidatus Caldarchaeum sp.]